MSLTLSRDQNGKPVLKPISIIKNPVLLNNLADSKPAGRETIYFDSVTIGDIVVDNTLPGKLNLTSSITAGTAEVGKALVLDNNRSATGINKLYVNSLYINGTLLNPSIFQGSAVAVSTDDSSRAELTGITKGKATANKALVLNGSGKIEGLNTIKTIAVENGNKILVNRPYNNIQMNNIEYFDRFNNTASVHHFESLFKTMASTGYTGDYTATATSINNNCYSHSLERHVAVFSDNTIGYSADGNNWKATGFGNVQFAQWFPKLSLFLAVGGNNLYTSANGINWTTNKIASINLFCIEWSEDLNLFVAGGQGSIVYSQTLFTEWTASSYNVSNIRKIIYIPSSKIFLARAENNTTSLLMSTDGKQWISQHVCSQTSASISDLMFCKSKNLILATMAGNMTLGRAYNNGLYSTDGGFTFKPMIAVNGSYGKISKICYIEECSLFLGVSTETGRNSLLMYSTDGVNWRGINVYSNYNAGYISSIIYNRKTGHVFLRCNTEAYVYRLNINSLFNTLSSYKLSSESNKINIGTDGSSIVNLGNEDGKIMNIYSTNDVGRAITLIDGELKISSPSISFESALISINDDKPLSLEYLNGLNKYTFNSYCNLNYFMTDERKKYNYLAKVNSNGEINIPGILKVNSLTVNGSLFNTSNNISEFKGNKIGIASANKFIISKYGNEVNGVDRVKCEGVQMDTVLVSSANETNINLGNKHGLILDKRPVNCLSRVSYLTGNSNYQFITNFMSGTPTTSETFYYIKELSTGFVTRGNSIIYSSINSNDWKNGTEVTLTSLFNANIGINKCEYIKELNTVYIASTAGLYMSKDLYTWKICNVVADRALNVADFTYSPQLRTMLIVSTNETQASKNGIDFRPITNNISNQQLNCVKWIEPWAMFVGITKVNTGGAKQFVYSYDGQIWDMVEQNNETVVKSASMPSAIVYSPKLDIAIAAVGADVRYTYNGIIWKSINAPMPTFSGNITWIDELELFIGSSTNVSAILYYSYDGIRWNYLAPGSTTYVLNRKWQYVHRTGTLVATTTS